MGADVTSVVLHFPNIFSRPRGLGYPSCHAPAAALVPGPSQLPGAQPDGCPAPTDRLCQERADGRPCWQGSNQGKCWGSEDKGKRHFKEVPTSSEPVFLSPFLT